MPRIKEQALKAELAKRGFESVSIKRELPGGRIQVEANKLYPVHVEAGESISVKRDTRTDASRSRPTSSTPCLSKAARRSTRPSPYLSRSRSTREGA